MYPLMCSGLKLITNGRTIPEQLPTVPPDQAIELADAINFRNLGADHAQCTFSILIEILDHPQ